MHCLAWTDAPTSDHVFPRAWYPDSTPQNIEKWQIPSCRKCNERYGKVEDDLLIRLGLCVDNDAAESLGIGTRVVNALNPARAKSDRDAEIRFRKARKLLAEANNNTAQSPALALSKQGGGGAGKISVSKRSLELLAEKIARGLVWLQLGRVVGPEYELTVSATPTSLEEFDSLVSAAGQIYERGPGIEVLWAQLPDDRACGIFRIRIFGQLLLRVAVIPRNATVSS